MLRAAPKSKGFLIDGYPRELDQGLKFENEVRSWIGHVIHAVIVLLTVLSSGFTESFLSSIVMLVTVLKCLSIVSTVIIFW